jgi:hypothetical protein
MLVQYLYRGGSVPASAKEGADVPYSVAAAAIKRAEATPFTVPLLQKRGAGVPYSVAAAAIKRAEATPRTVSEVAAATRQLSVLWLLLLKRGLEQLPILRLLLLKRGLAQLTLLRLPLKQRLMSRLLLLKRRLNQLRYRYTVCGCCCKRGG